MGVLTHAQIVTEALELAGNTGLSTRAQTWLTLVLRRLGEGFQFPQMDNPRGTVTGSAGTATFTAGSPYGGTADVLGGTPIQGIHRVLIASSTLDDYQDLAREHVKNVSPGTLSDGVRRGRPTTFMYESRGLAGGGGFLVTLAPTPDLAYRYLVIAEGRSPAQYTYSASAVNGYPDDWTVIQGVYAMALQHQQDERAMVEMEKFEDMMKKDRVRLGNASKAYSTVGLGGPHRVRSRNSGGGWMGDV